MKEIPWCSQRRLAKSAQFLGEFRWWAWGHRGSGKIGGIYLFWNASDTHTKNCLACSGGIKDLQSVLPYPWPPKVFTSKSIFSVTIYCCILLSGCEKPHGKIAMLHVFNWPCRALPLVHAPSQEVKRQVCQAHAEKIIMKPTRICKSVCSLVHLHSFSLVL